MSRTTGPKHKLSRRYGVNLTGTTSRSLARKLAEGPAVTRARRRKPTDYAIRLRAKNRVRLQYDLTEHQFRRFYEIAQRLPGQAGPNLLQLLERRLDSVIYRLGYARTRPMGRQLVNHGHIEVNGHKVDIPSYIVKPGEVVSVAEKSRAIPLVQEELEGRHALIPGWLSRDGASARVIGLPTRADADADIREDLIVEFYAR